MMTNHGEVHGTSRLLRNDNAENSTKKAYNYTIQ